MRGLESAAKRRRCGVAATLGATLAVLAAGCSSGPPSGLVTTSGGGSIDTCLVGNWVATGITSSFSATGAEVTLTGGAGFDDHFFPNGALVADWSHMSPLATDVPVEITQTYGGQSTYQVSTSDGTLHFLSADYSHWQAQQDWAGQVTTMTGPNPVPDESYTCDGTTFTENAPGWQATFARQQ